MILYFSGTGNSLAIARQLSEQLDERLMPLVEAVNQDLTNEKRIGLVLPTYDFNMPLAVRTLVPQLRISPKAYVFAVITCGGQVGNTIWTLRRLLHKQGVKLAYSHKISLPDNSALAFGRNPNLQTKKFERVPARIEQIVSDLQAERHVLHYSWFSFFSWIMGLPAMERGMIRTLGPQVNPDKCIGCNTCVRICPMNNISLQQRSDLIVERSNSVSGLTGKANQVALIGDNCTACLACVHVCPQQAVSTNGRKTLKERQYRHPDIKLKDLIKR